MPVRPRFRLGETGEAYPFSRHYGWDKLRSRWAIQSSINGIPMLYQGSGVHSGPAYPDVFIGNDFGIVLFLAKRVRGK